MGEINVSFRMKVKSFYITLIKEFTYLYAGLRYPDGKGVDIDASIVNARSKSTTHDYAPIGNISFCKRQY